MRGLPKLLFALLVVVLTIPTGVRADPAAVDQSFAAYKQALVEGDGEAASKLTAADTHAFLDETLERALTMEAAEVRALPLLDQISVLMLRHNMKPEQLRAMQKSDAVAYAVDQRAFDMDEVERLTAAPFSVNGDRAQAELSNLKGSPIPVSVHFKEEADGWKFDLLSSIAPFRAVFESQAGLFANLKTSDGKSGVVPLILHLISGRAPDANIWNPPG
ncbi:hypothetical protein HBA54_01915 [Pelagibius litoralis]|uniref:Uncharacterized protein n=1 Tax=Pelagibius litoralis TaxID=374515 RepID=A0A967C6P3_9PROT|nr:hypothetical protein [Pelagibius litoralis]NIA67342.1 hypothetical protein [Pelagibius litoralis]